MTFAELSIEAFHEELAGGSPTPGGGSAAAITAASAASAVEMVCQLTSSDDEFEDIHEEMSNRRAELTSLRKELHSLADEDAAAFEAVMDAFRQPEGPERSEAIQSAMVHAAEIPLETATRCVSVMEHAQYAAVNGNQNAVTDAATGALLANAALQSALYNVDINLVSIDDEETVASMRARRDELRERADALMQQVTEHVDGAI